MPRVTPPSLRAPTFRLTGRAAALRRALDQTIRLTIRGLPRPGRPPLVAIVPLLVGFLGALGAQHLVDADRPAQLTSDPTSQDAPASAVSAPAPIAATAAPAGPSAPPPPADEPALTRQVLTPAPRAPSADTTRERALEAKLAKVLADGKTPYAATVLIEIGTGRVLAIAEHSTRGPAEGLAQKPMAPAASIFKLVTSSALLQAGVRANTEVCTHGGKTRMNPDLLVDNPKRDHRCATFGDVVPQSLNVAIAKLALKHLDPDRLRAEAARWGFGEKFATMQASVASIPDDPFAFANAAAGFGDVKISALHGAMIAAAVAQDGLLVAPRFDDADDRAPARRAMPVEVARSLKRMMVETVAEGTARRAFSQAPRLTISSGGKTGSLADYKTGLDTSWFVGFAPADRPAVAVATVVVNTSIWHVKAPAVAKEALRTYFQAHPLEKPRELVARR